MVDDGSESDGPEAAGEGVGDKGTEERSKTRSSGKVCESVGCFG